MLGGGDCIGSGVCGAGVGCGHGYIVFNIFAIFCTPWMIGSPIFIPGGGAVE